MPKRRYERREPTHDWQEIRPLLKDSVQITYEILRADPPVRRRKHGGWVFVMQLPLFAEEKRTQERQ